MQNRGRKNSETVNENFQNSIGPKYPYNELSDSSEDYDEAQISYHFRRWANNVWSLSNNVTNRLRELLGNNPTTNSTTSNSGAEEDSRDERITTNGTTGWTTPKNVTESSKHIYDGIHSRHHRYHRHAQSHNRNEPSRGNYCSYGQIFSHVADDHRIPKIIPKRVDTDPFGLAHGVATFPPVLVLRSLHKGVYREPGQGKFNHSVREKNIHNDEYADGWYNHSGIRKWEGCGGPRGGENCSSSIERHEIPERLSSLRDESRSRSSEGKYTGIDSIERDIEPSVCDYESTKHFVDQTSGSDFGNWKRDDKPASHARRESRRSREKTLGASAEIARNCRINEPRQKSGHTSKASSLSKAREVVWDMKLSDLTARELSSSSSSTSYFRLYDNLEIPAEDGAKKRKAGTISSAYDKNTVQNSGISHIIRKAHYTDDGEAKSNCCQKQADGMMTTNSLKWSSVTENNFDLLLKSLRDRIETLANINPTDDTGRSMKNLSGLIETSNDTGGVKLRNGCVLATCLTGNNQFPSSFDTRNERKIDGYYLKANEDVRPSFYDRIQDIWRDGRPRVWRSSPRSEITSSLAYNFKSGKDVSSKLSFLGLNQQPALREYFAEYNSAVTLARILEKLIETKSRSDNPPPFIPKEPKSQPTFNRNESRLGLVDVGVQNSSLTFITDCQNPTPNSRDGLSKNHATRRSFKSRVPEVLVERPKNLQVVTEQSVISIPKIEFKPVVQPCRDGARLTKPSMDARALSTFHDSPNVRHGHSVIVDNPIVEDKSSATFLDTGLKNLTEHNSLVYSKCRDFKLTSIAPQHDSSYFSRGSPFVVEARYKPPPDIFYSAENANAVTVNQIKHERQQFATLDSAMNPQQIPTNSPILRLRDPRVLKKSSEAAFKDISEKNRSWWPRKFYFGKSSVLKGKITSLLRYVTKKYGGNRSSYPSKENVFETAMTEDVIPTPPIRKKRKGVVGKFSKSIQWELDTTVLYSAQRMNTFQMPVNHKVTVTTGTNTSAKKSDEISFIHSAKKLSKQNKVSLVKTAGNKVSEKKVYADSFNKGRLSNRTTVKTDKDVNVTKRSELPRKVNDKARSDDRPFFIRENFKSLSNPVREEEKESSGEKNLKTSSSLSSEIPLASELVNPFDTSQTIFSNRPSTAPMPKNLSSEFSRSKAPIEDTEGDKTSDKDSSSQLSSKKVLFKHNRSSLLRANNGMLKKSATRPANLSKRKPGDRDHEIVSILKSLMSSETVNNKGSAKLLPVNKTGSRKLVTETQFEENKLDRSTKGLSLTDVEMKDILEPPAKSSTSEQQVAKETSYFDNNDVSYPKIKDTMHKTKKIDNSSAISTKSQPISPKHGMNKWNKRLPGDGGGFPQNSECLKEKRRLLKARNAPLNVELSPDSAPKERETSLLSSKSRKVHAGDRSMKGKSITVKEEKSCWQSSPALRRKRNQVKAEKDEILSNQLEENKFGSTEFAGSTNKIPLTNSDLAEMQSDDDKKFTTDERSLLLGGSQNLNSCETEIAIDGETNLKSQLVYSTVSKTGKHFFKQTDVPVHRLTVTSRNEETGSRGNSVKLKSDHNTIKSRKPLGKSFGPLDQTIGKSNSENTDDFQCPAVEAPGFDKPDSTSANKIGRASPPATNHYNTWNKNGRAELMTRRKSRSKNTKEMVKAARRMLDAVINESIKVDWKTEGNPENVYSENIFCNSDSFDDENVTEFLSETVTLIDNPISKNNAKKIDKEKQFSLPKEEEKKSMRTCTSSESGLRDIADADNEKQLNNCRERSSSEKFLVTSESLPKNETDETRVPLEGKKDDLTIESHAENVESSFCGGFEIGSRDNKSEIAVRLLKVNAEMDGEKCTENTQSIVGFTSVEAEKLCPSMLDVHLETYVELSESKPRDNNGKSIGIPKSINLWDSQKMTNDEISSLESNEGDRNVKIDDKLLEEKVKCSIENGVPLKTITITDPSIIKLGSTAEEKDIRKMKLKNGRSEAEQILSNLLISSESSSSEVQSEKQCSTLKSLLAGEENRNIIGVEDKILTEDSVNTESHAEGEPEQIIDESTRAVDQNNLVPTTASVQLKKRATVQRGTLIPSEVDDVDYSGSSLWADSPVTVIHALQSLRALLYDLQPTLAKTSTRTRGTWCSHRSRMVEYRSHSRARSRTKSSVTSLGSAN